jgi:cytochrome c-type biogenesis protein CcmH
MTPFWTISLFWISTFACVAIALAFVLPALLRPRTRAGKARREVNIAIYRDQLKELEADHANGLLPEEQYQAARQELQARLAEDALAADEAPAPGRFASRRLGYALGAALPIAAFGLYFWLGNPAAVIAAANAEAAHPALAETQGGHDFMQMIQRVEAKTRANPEDGNAWAMLAKTYAATGQWPQALQAYAKAAKLLPQDASVLSGYAEALAVDKNHVLAGEPLKWARKALALDLNDVKGLELAGVHAFQENDFAQAILYFRHLHQLLPPDSAYARDILAARKEAEARLAQNGGAAPHTPGDTPAAGSAAPPAGAAIKGSIDITPALKSRLAATDVLFVFARAGEKGPPVAVMRASAARFPLEFELNDSMAMGPGNTLSQHKQVMLVARVSKSGSPMAQGGDLEGVLPNVKVGLSDAKILIDQTRP